MPTFKLGHEGRLYYLSTGTRATWGTTANGITTGAAPGNLSEVDGAGDVTVETSADDVEVKIRRMRGQKATAYGLSDVMLEFPLLYEPANAAYLAIELAHASRGTIAMAALDADKATNGTKGVWADFVITKFPQPQPLGDVMVVNVVAKQAVTTVPGERVKVG
jgi:hypothetical protein